MRYKKFIEENFLIDHPDTGELVPFIFRPVQNKYYEQLCQDYGIEQNGIASGIREIILKARKEGFTSLILAIFAADDLRQAHPTETLVFSYKDEATKTFRNRYKNFILSAYAKKLNKEVRQISDKEIRSIFSEAESGNYRLRHNGAHFYCGTASAHTAERGGTTHKLLFSEAAHYPDVEKITAKEIIEGTLRQVSIHGGMVFLESTANGYGNHYEKTWSLAERGESRFKPRFFGWQEFYTKDEYDLVYSETTDKAVFRQEMPGTPEEAFISTGSPYFDNEMVLQYLKNSQEPSEVGDLTMEGEEPMFTNNTTGELKIWERPKEGDSYVIGGDTAEGTGADENDSDYQLLKVRNNRTLKICAKFKSRCMPDEMAKQAYALGMWYNTAYMGIEVNKDGLWVNTELFKMGYPNLYWREAIDDVSNRVGRKLGFKTDMRTRPYILSELRKMLVAHSDIWQDREELEEFLTFVRRHDGKPGAMTGKHDDEIFADAICLEIRRNAPAEFAKEEEEETSYVKMRLEALYGNKEKGVSQQDYV